MEWFGTYAAVNLELVIQELLAVKAANEELTKRVVILEEEVRQLASNKRHRGGIRYM